LQNPLNKPLIIDYKIALAKVAKYCAYQERCHYDVEKKLRELNVDEEIQDEIISDLIQQNFLNEERYTIAYVQGKVNIKKWGRKKIKYELHKKYISQYCINKALSMIDEDDYLVNLQSIIEKKRSTINGKSDYDKRTKLFRYLHSKGYETEIINNNIDEYGS